MDFYILKCELTLLPNRKAKVTVVVSCVCIKRTKYMRSGLEGDWRKNLQNNRHQEHIISLSSLHYSPNSNFFYRNRNVNVCEGGAVKLCQSTLLYPCFFKTRRRSLYNQVPPPPFYPQLTPSSCPGAVIVGFDVCRYVNLISVRGVKLRKTTRRSMCAQHFL